MNKAMRRVLAFWFGEEGDSDWGDMRKLWFHKDDAFDQACRDGFLDLYEQAERGDHDDWMASADGCLALLILLDQLPRNMFRGDARMYTTDDKALAIAQHVAERSFDKSMTDVQKLFAHLPFEHAEDLEHQHLHCAYIQDHYHGPQRDECLKAAARHQEIIERFGRFPHRNEILGRASADEEIAFLKGPDSSF